MGGLLFVEMGSGYNLYFQCSYSIGLSRRDSTAMWVLAGGNEKSNPWR